MRLSQLGCELTHVIFSDCMKIQLLKRFPCEFQVAQRHSAQFPANEMCGTFHVVVSHTHNDTTGFPPCCRTRSTTDVFGQCATSAGPIHHVQIAPRTFRPGLLKILDEVLTGAAWTKS